MFVEAFRDLVDICAVDVRRKDRAPERSFRRHVYFESKPPEVCIKLTVRICQRSRARWRSHKSHEGRRLSSADLQVVVKPLPFVCLILFEVTT